MYYDISVSYQSISIIIDKFYFVLTIWNKDQENKSWLILQNWWCKLSFFYPKIPLKLLHSFFLFTPLCSFFYFFISNEAQWRKFKWSLNMLLYRLPKSELSQLKDAATTMFHFGGGVLSMMRSVRCDKIMLFLIKKFDFSFIWPEPSSNYSLKNPYGNSFVWHLCKKSAGPSGLTLASYFSENCLPLSVSFGVRPSLGCGGTMFLFS